MADPEDCRVFVGGLSWDTTDKALEQAFRQFGKVVEARVMHDRDTGRPRGFGFVTFADEQSMEDAIAELHNGELDGRTISVNKAQPKMSGAGNYDYGGGYSNGGNRGGYSRGGGSEDCFKCGKPGHWARECPFGPGSGRFPPRYGGGGGGRNDRYGGGGPGNGGRDRERERFGRDRYGDSYGRDNRGGYGRESGRDRYGSGGPARYGGGYRDRAGPYDRPGGRSFYDDHY